MISTARITFAHTEAQRRFDLASAQLQGVQRQPGGHRNGGHGVPEHDGNDGYDCDAGERYDTGQQQQRKHSDQSECQ